MLHFAGHEDSAGRTAIATSQSLRDALCSVANPFLYNGVRWRPFLLRAFRALSVPRWRKPSWRRVDGYEVWTSSTGKRENLADVVDKIDFHEGDLVDLDAVHRACRGVDYVLHEAAIPSVPKSVLDPIGNNIANVDGTLNLLVAARDANVKRVSMRLLPRYGDTPTCQT